MCVCVCVFGGRWGGGRGERLGERGGSRKRGVAKLWVSGCACVHMCGFRGVGVIYIYIYVMPY